MVCTCMFVVYSRNMICCCYCILFVDWFRVVVDASLALLSSPLGSGVGSITPHLQHIIKLSLGSMAGLLTQQDPLLAKQVTDILGVELDHITGLNPSSSSSRLRRSADVGNADPLLHAVVLDSIGNAQAPQLLDGLVRHLTDESSLTVKHSAVKALGRYQSEEVCRVQDCLYQRLDVFLLLLQSLLSSPSPLSTHTPPSSSLSPPPFPSAPSVSLLPCYSLQRPCFTWQRQVLIHL